MQPAVPYSLSWPLALLVASTLLYLLLDMYLLSKRFLEIFQTIAFYLLWLVYTVLALVAYGAIRVSSMSKIQGFVEHPQIAEALLLLLSVLAALTVVPSFSLKLSDFKVIDIGQLVDRFRNTVYSSITDRVLANRRADGQATADALARKFAGKPADLRNALGTLLQLSGESAPNIAARLAAVQTLVTTAGLSEVTALANALVLQDPARAQRLLKEQT